MQKLSHPLFEVHWVWGGSTLEAKRQNMRDAMRFHDNPEYYTMPKLLTFDLHQLEVGLGVRGRQGQGGGCGRFWGVHCGGGVAGRGESLFCSPAGSSPAALQAAVLQPAAAGAGGRGEEGG